MSKSLLILLIVLFNISKAQEFRIQRPVPDNIQTNGSYLYGEPSVSNPGKAHNGTDILVKWDTVYSATDGVVTFVGYSSDPADTGAFHGYEPNGAGNYIFVRSLLLNTNYYFLYGHLTRPFVTVNQNVTKGQPIALSGNTGYSTGAHLHFEIRKGSQSSTTKNKRNAELWCGISGTGAIYGRVPNAPDNTRVDISPNPKPRPPYTTYGYSLTYLFADSNIGSDDFYNENYAIGDVKPGTYTITSLNGAYRRVVTVTAGKVVNADLPTGIFDENPVAADFVLEQNYPNPFNPTTKIRYSIPTSPQSPHLQGEEVGVVTLKVYDILGNEVATLVNEEQAPGIYEVEFSTSTGTSQLASGVYLYRLKAGNFSQNKKMILLK